MAGSVVTGRFGVFKCLVLSVVSLQIAVLSGCGLASSGKSDADRFKQGLDNFSGLVQSAGGTATLGEQELSGIKAAGWSIDLSGGKVTDSLIDKIIEAGRGSPILVLNLSRTAVTDAQLGKLDKSGALSKVADLDLSETKITDAGLDQINAVAVLMKLKLKGSEATKEGAERLGNRKIANRSTPPPFRVQPELDI